MECQGCSFYASDVAAVAVVAAAVVAAVAAAAAVVVVVAVVSVVAVVPLAEEGAKDVTDGEPEVNAPLSPLSFQTEFADLKEGEAGVERSRRFRTLL